MSEESIVPVWVHFGEVLEINFVGNNVLCVSGHSDCHLLFHDIITGENLYYKANSKEKGDGVKCFDGHKKFPVIAIAELCLKPRIIVFAYPSFELIVQMKNAATIGYLAVAFSATEYLVALTSLPEFAVIVWIWRTGEKLAVKQSNIFYDNQILKYSNSSAFIQVATNSIRSYTVWDLHVCGKRCALSSYTVNLPHGHHGICDVLYTPNGNVLVLDSGANVYEKLVNENKTEMVIKWAEINKDEDPNQQYYPCFTWHLDGIVVAGRSTSIVYYVQDPSSLKWVENLRLNGDYMLHFLRPITIKDSERLYASARDGRINLINLNDDKINQVQTFPLFTRCISFTLLWPVGEYLVTLNEYYDLIVWKIETGKPLSILHLQIPTTFVYGNPKWPVLNLGCENGTLILLNALDVCDLIVMQSIRLMEHPIEIIQSTYNGDYTLVGNHSYGMYFVLKGEPKTSWWVLSHIDFSSQIVCNCLQLLLNENVLKLYFLHVTSDTFIIGDQCTVCTLNLPTTTATLDKKIIIEPEKCKMNLLSNYTQIQPIHVHSADGHGMFYGVPHGSRQIHHLMANEDTNKFMLIKTDHSGHQLSMYSIYRDSYHLMTYGVDGICFIYDETCTDLRSKLILHHRLRGGIQSAIIDPTGRYIVSMSKFKTLICSKLDCEGVTGINLVSSCKKRMQEESYKQNFTELYNDDELFEVGDMNISHATLDSRRSSRSIKPAILQKYKDVVEKHLYQVLRHRSTSTTTDDSSEFDEVPTWLQLIEEEKLLNEAIQCAEARQEIFDGLKTLRRRLSEMLDANEHAPENEKLPISEFNLDEDWIEARDSENKYECEKLKYYLAHLMEERNKVSQYIIDLFWTPTKVKHRTLRELYSTLEVDNYPIIPKSVDDKDTFDILFIRRKIELMLSKHDMFTPWIVYPNGALKEFLKQSPEIYHEDEATRILNAMEVDENDAEVGDEVTAVEFDESNRILYGTTSHLYIDVESMPRYTQFENHSYIQFRFLSLSYTFAGERLCLYFNKKFDEVSQLKERELSLVNERIARFRHILSELKNNEIVIQEPYVPDTETPEKLINVEPHEIPITPYISPSEQAKLDAEEAERERIRLLLLADDFRERALMKMMDGVLEIRWEDEIKKDIPPPVCVLEKDPKNYNEEDLLAIAAWEKAVEFRLSERERYRKMLENEYQKLAVEFRESIQKFNAQLRDLYLLRLKVIQSVIQEEFIFANKRKIHFERILDHQREKEAEREISENEKIIEQLQKELAYLNTALNECRANMDTLMNKDRSLEKNYRKDLPRVSSLSMEAYLKVLRRRPRYHLKSTSHTLYYQLASCLNTHNRPLFLPDESLEYLKSLDILDQMVGVPNIVLEEHFDAIRRIRRAKIESEIRIKGMSYELAEAEATIQFYSKKLAYRRDLREKLITKLNKTRSDQLHNSHNILIQLVLKQGLVEVPLSGHTSDFESALLVNRDQVLDVNRMINKAGRIKLAAMYKDMVFRRQIIQTEWDHQHKVMQIEDLRNFIRTIQKIRIYRDVIDYLKIKSKGEHPDKHLVALDKEEANIREEYTRFVVQLQEKYEDLEERVVARNQDTERLNKRIKELNIDVWEDELKRKKDMEAEFKDKHNKRIDNIMKRGKLLRKIQKQFNEILVLQTELELLRLRTYPTLKYNPI